MNIVLIGFMCSGKSRVGRLLAQRLGRTFIDTDDWVANKAGLPVAEVIRTQGEAAFRTLEKEAVREASQATGGDDSAPCRS